VADAALREIERAYVETGAPADGARLVAALLRRGATTPEAVEVACELGDVNAARALGRAPGYGSRRPHLWHAAVRRALGRRLLFRLHEPWVTPRLVGWNVIDGTEVPEPTALRGALAPHAVWEARADYFGHSTALVVRAPREAFADIGEFWVELALTHPVIHGAAPGETFVELARRHLREVEHDRVRSSKRSFEGSLVGPSLRLSDVWPVGPVVVAYKLSERLRVDHHVAETATDFFIRYWRSDDLR
jgi:hypothetical protein